MYKFIWDNETGGYNLSLQHGNSVIANGIRPVWAKELISLGFDEKFDFDKTEELPLMWAKRNEYWYLGEKVAQVNNKKFGEPIARQYFFENRLKLNSVNVTKMVENNFEIMKAIETDTKKRIKEMYEVSLKKCDAAYIGFSGGKDSMVLLDLCHKVLPFDVPVVFSDTDMELPDSYKIWEKVKSRYSEREFIIAKAKRPAIENWELFGPPSQVLRWCCYVHKSTPAILELKKRMNKQSIKVMAFVGVRSEESVRRAEYKDIGDEVKSRSQINVMPILDWETHELFLYHFEHNLLINEAYKKGLSRVGCVLCPMSNIRQNEFIYLNYKEAVTPFINKIKGSITREFLSENDINMFIFEGGWHARKSGVSLKDVIIEPGIKYTEDTVVFDFQPEIKNNLKMWIKTIGNITKTNENKFELKYKNSFVEIYIKQNNFVSEMICFYGKGNFDKTLIKYLTSAIHKAMACIGCCVCESNCPTGALSVFAKYVSIDTKKCIHCMQCHTSDTGCLRYYSKRYAGGNSMNVSGINKYLSFGLKPDWISILADKPVNFRNTGELGNRMIPSAITWFKEAGLIEESTTIVPTLLLDIGRKLEFKNSFFWKLIWIRLANISPLIKWFVCNCGKDENLTIKQIDEKLTVFVTSNSVRKGALQSLSTTIKSSPVGDGENAWVNVEKKGKNVEGLTRKSVNVEGFVVLYGLYIMAQKIKRNAFTIREMLDANFESDYLSPLFVFGMPVDIFKNIIQGLESKYPSFINCSFTLGLDEVRVFGNNKSINDVLKLILEEY